MNKKLEALLERASTWPEEAQAELMQTIVDIETKHFGVYQLDESERSAVQRGLREMRDGELATDEEVTRVFSRYRP
jgi:predicted transcriptional regulator